MDANFSQLEKKILKFWKKNKTFERSIKNRAKAGDFVFYEGPPTANGKPGIHHVLARTYKDIICRYKTMQGFRVLRKAGWDTHGLPVELETEKKLGLKNKKDIEKYGVAQFNKKCKESVWQYKDEWERLTERIGFWLDMKNPYITYENNYIESLWRIIKQIYQKGLLYKDYKVVPYCPRCGTSLSSHEVAQGYKAIKENSIYIKFKIAKPKSIVKEGDYLLAWTTTPWTLPANVALAINEKFDYVRIEINNEFYILAKERLGIIDGNYEIKSTFNGGNLIGLEYEPLFNFSKPDKKAYFVVGGSFVSLEEGTGLVHIAPAFGEEDLEVAKQNNLPVLVTVDENGCLTLHVKQWAGMFIKDADPLIIEDLKKRNLLYREELYEHDYPFCWRCDSPLLYYAKESWFINMQKVKKQLIGNNQKINWIPSHLKEGRFGEWLREIKDWAFSRERYWGTPLPIWQCRKCAYQEAIGSQEDLVKQKFTNNKYFILRHGEALMNTRYINVCWPEKVRNPLTKKGQSEILKAVRTLKKKKIDLIFSSDLLRTRQTAEIIAKETGAKLIFDKRIREFNIGTFNRKKSKLVWGYLNHKKNLIETKIPKGESLLDIQKRMTKFLEAMDKKHKNKNILIISHELPISVLEGSLRGVSLKDILARRIKNKEARIKTGEWREIKFKKLPRNEKMELDFHRPYIDEVKFQCQRCSGLMERVPELIDVWFDSGAMPFAQYHYPFDKNIQFPADYVSEAIDQTRGWFYTLLAVATLLGRSTPYKNVISLGHVLDEKGEKMSKSKGNVIDPWYIIEKYGADAARWYFYTVNQPGDSKLFSEKELAETLKKFIMTFWNSYLFFQTYRQKIGQRMSNHVLDRWIVSRLNGLILETTEKLDKYDVTGSARAIENFAINDLSLWYIRRSRKRFQEASATLRHVLLTLSKLTAPFIPFLSEEIYKKMIEVRPQSSVHLEIWPKVNKKLINEKLNQKMEKVRKIVNLALAERVKAGIKVRQSLASLEIPNPCLAGRQAKSQIPEELLNLIKEELNVKEIVFGKEVKLDTKITPELKEEGTVREIVRQIQAMRKKAGLKPKDKILIQYFGAPELNKILENNKKIILEETKAKDFRLRGKLKKVFDIGKELKVDQQILWLTIKKL